MSEMSLNHASSAVVPYCCDGIELFISLINLVLAHAGCSGIRATKQLGVMLFTVSLFLKLLF